MESQESGPKQNARRRNRVIYSCLECRRRKMKCDRTDPCENCRTSGLQCNYVKSAVTDAEIRRKLNEAKEAKDAIDGALRGNFDNRHLIPEKAEPLRKRTRQPNEAPNDQSESSGEDAYLEPTPLAVQDAAYADDAQDEVEDLGIRIGRMRLSERIGGLYRPRIADEILSSLQHSPPAGTSPITSTTTYEPSQTKRSFADPSINLFFNQSSEHHSATQHIPPRNVADKILDHYWIAVHPVARIVHRPSFAQRYETLWELVENGHPVTTSLVAIVMSVLFSAVVAMSEARVEEICRTSREEMKHNLQLGTEAALGKANLVRSTKIETLQAFVAYLLPMCVDEISRSHSVLTGMAIRLAECMGLHRDPTEYGFSPAECQTRRLVWYQICYLDLKTSEVQGPRAFIHEDGYTTKLPLDVTTPGLLPPNTPPVYNDLIFSMVRFECQEMQRRCLTLRTRVDQKKLSLTKAVSKIEAFRIAMDAKYGPYLNTSSPSPMQKMSSLVMRLFISIQYLVLLHRYMNSVTYRIPDRLRQLVLVKGTEALEAAVELESSEAIQPWAWYSSSYQQYHTAFLLLFEVFHYPMRKVATRIWKCLDFIFADTLTVIPPISTAGTTPTLQETIAHRDVKVRYLLTVICERMNVYQRVRGLKSPVEFNDSMILVTPQKEGDSSDPKFPLNYAHGEPEIEHRAHDLNAVSQDPTSCPRAQDSGMAKMPFDLPAHSRPGPNTAVPHDLNNEASGWASSGDFSPWIQYGELGPDGHAGTWPNLGLHSSDASSVTANEGSSSTQYVQVQHPQVQVQQPEGVDSQMLEIDWTLWDSIFSPQVNDGNLDISDQYSWMSQGTLDSAF